MYTLHLIIKNITHEEQLCCLYVHGHRANHWGTGNTLVAILPGKVTLVSPAAVRVLF